jgi:magnesium-transporting ATPase (P-type)
VRTEQRATVAIAVPAAPTDHASPADEVLQRLASGPDGLSADEAARRLQLHGPNLIPPAKRQSLLIRWLLQFHHVLIYALLASAAITALLGHYVDTVVIVAVVLANALIGFIQEGKAESALQSIRKMLALRANVLRDGRRTGIDAQHLVPGDIVLLEAGDKVPADLRLLSARGLTVQEAVLTGESAPVDKQTLAVPADAQLGDRACIAFSGTLVNAGQGTGVVIATGADTEIGRISHLLDDVQTLVTPLLRQMHRFAQWLTLAILVVALALLAYGYFSAHHAFGEMFMAVVSLSVAAIPEGLPAVLTITLATGVQAVARRHVIVRRLPAIETLGSVSVICTDKTGTLTRNEMMVAAALVAGRPLVVSGEGYSPEGQVSVAGQAVSAADEPALHALALGAALCNDAVLTSHGHTYTAQGDPMEGALLAFAARAGIDAQQVRRTWKRCDAIPFDASYRYMATLNHAIDGRSMQFIKGAPERVLAMCITQFEADGRRAPIDIGYWQAEIDALAAQGMRVLAFANADVVPEMQAIDHHHLQQGLTLLGLVGMIDPPRPEAIAAVAECQRAGIRVKMITGDHAKTAMAIGAQIGLANVSTVLTGADLDALSDAALQQAVTECDVFARTDPAHKLRLVMALQSCGHIVAMTGDGVNDAPALRRADAGVAMGDKGSEAAKEAAELVLVDDNFASIAAAVREGRIVYDNIRKVISWTLPTNAGEALTIIVALLLGFTLPITPAQLLWVNLITAVTLGLALAFEPAESDVMRRPPRPAGEPLLDASLAWHIVLVSLLFVGAVYGIYHRAVASGYSLELARTLAVNTLVVMEIFHLFFIRSLRGTALSWQGVKGTPVIWLCVIVVTLAQLAFTYLPPLQAAFDTRAVPVREGLLVLACGVALLLVIEAEKALRRAVMHRLRPMPHRGWG